MSKVPIPEDHQKTFKMYWGLNPNTKTVYPFTGSIGQWSRLMESVDKVGDDYVGDVHVSTVFLGVNHASDCEKPVLFETMAFGGGPDYDQYQERYYTYQEALDGHKRILEQVTNEIPLIPRKTFKIKF